VRGGNYGGMRRQPEIVVGAEVDDFMAVDGDGRGLRALEHALFFVEAAFANVRNLRLEDGLELSFHPGILAKKRTALQRR